MIDFLQKIFIPNAEAHVRYIADEQKLGELGGADWQYLFSPLVEGQYLLMMLATVLIAGLIFYIAYHNDKSRHYFDRVRERATSYTDLMSWLVRLPLGIGLLGFGSYGVLLSPVLETTPLLAIIQTLVGFMLLTGFLLPFASVAVIILYFIAISQDIYMIGSLDILGLGIILLIIDSRRPGVDHLLGILDISYKKFTKYVPTILRLCFGTGLAYLAVYEKILNPRLSEFVVMVSDLCNVIPVSEAMWVFSAGVIELVIGLMLIIGLFTRLFAAVTFAVLSLSFFYFGEEVTSHITLFGSLAILFVTGGGPFSLDSYIRNKPHVLTHNETEE